MDIFRLIPLLLIILIWEKITITKTFLRFQNFKFINNIVFYFNDDLYNVAFLVQTVYIITILVIDIVAFLLCSSCHLTPTVSYFFILHTFKPSYFHILSFFNLTPFMSGRLSLMDNFNVRVVPRPRSSPLSCRSGSTPPLPLPFPLKAPAVVGQNLWM